MKRSVRHGGVASGPSRRLAKSWLRFSITLMAVAQAALTAPVITEVSVRPTAPRPDVSAHVHHTETVLTEDGLQHRMFLDNHHFASIIDKNGTFIIRCHPGVDLDGWGTSVYLQPYAGDEGTLSYTSIQDIIPTNGFIAVTATGMVSRSTNATFGVWNAQLDFSFDPTNKLVQASGSYNIALPAPLGSILSNLNLLKIASNKLNEVPRLSGGTGDTGDMLYADVTSSNPLINFRWMPEDIPGHYPTNLTDQLTIGLVTTNISDVDAIALGQPPIDATYKPNTSVALTSLTGDANMSFGGFYDVPKSQQHWEDNVGITPLVPHSVTRTNFSYSVAIVATALPQDGIGMDVSLRATYPGSSTNFVEVYASDTLPAGLPRRLVGRLPQTSNSCFQGTVSVPSLTGTAQPQGFFLITGWQNQ